MLSPGADADQVSVAVLQMQSIVRRRYGVGITDPDSCDFDFCGGRARPEDTHLWSIVHAVDDEIIAWLRQREQRRERKRDRLARLGRASFVGLNPCRRPRIIVSGT
jgi:hypothetical protein